MINDWTSPHRSMNVLWVVGLGCGVLIHLSKYLSAVLMDFRHTTCTYVVQVGLRSQVPQGLYS
jgi:hypothetical protein